MEQNETKTEQQQEQSTMSPFCEGLMDESLYRIELRRAFDSAILICSDGKQVASRMCGVYPMVVNMIYSKMVADDKFAEVIMDAAMRYSLYKQDKSNDEKPFKEDAPHADVKPLN